MPQEIKSPDAVIVFANKRKVLLVILFVPALSVHREAALMGIKTDQETMSVNAHIREDALHHAIPPVYCFDKPLIHQMVFITEFLLQGYF